MRSFRTEIENPIVERDIIDLERKIRLYREGKINEEKFRSLRLARGVYGQRQPGVQMVRIKLPYGRVSTRQLRRIADISDEYSTGNLHLTTRQDIQIHYVSLDRTPELWGKLEQDDITIREACGNTVRNITASAIAGIDPEEPFDVSPYAHAMFEYFLRNPICQELGRKFKITFSSSARDTAHTYMHDLGFIPKVRYEDGVEQRGFKVMIGGGLGAQPYVAGVAHHFLPEDRIIPFTESVLRVFDRHGERANRHKARMKYLIEKIGLDELLRLAEEERLALKSASHPIDHAAYHAPEAPSRDPHPPVNIVDAWKYEAWLRTNTFEQKQPGYRGVFIRVQTGDISTDLARSLASVVERFAADDIRITIEQGLLLKFVRADLLEALFVALDAIGLAEPGYGSTVDITTCPGTDTCNLGITSSTGITRELERVIADEYPELLYNTDIRIKISGCMNACGQHAIANIGFHGSSIKMDAGVLPALQVLLGGGPVRDGEGRTADRIIKVPSRRGPDALRSLLDDYEANALDGEYFNDYYDRQGRGYFQRLLKPLADLAEIRGEEFIDWGDAAPYAQAIGVGECVGVMIDLVATLLYEAEEKLAWAGEALLEGRFADSIYHSYSGFVGAAKALLLERDVACNTQHGIIRDFDAHFTAAHFELDAGFATHVMRINSNEPSKKFAEEYLADAERFIEAAHRYRNRERVEIALPAAVVAARR